MRIINNPAYYLLKVRLCFVSLVVIFLLPCCSKQKLIPKKTLESILKEVYLTNGLANFSEISEEYPQRSLSLYTDIYDRYGYSEEEVNNTLKYYFIHKNEKLVKIYNSLIGEFNVESALLSEKNTIEDDGLEVDRQKYEYFYFPSEDSADMAYFEHRLTYAGTYTLNFKVTVDPSDMTVNPGVYIWSESAGLEDKQEVASFQYIKDGNTYSFAIPISKADRRVIQLRGYLFYTTGNPSVAGRNAIIKEVKVDYAALQ